MNVLVLWSIIGLLNSAFAYDKHENKHNAQVHHAGRYHGRHHITIAAEESPEPLTLPQPTAIPLANYEGLNLIFDLEKKTLAFANVTENVGFAYVVREEGILKLLVDSKSGTTLRYFHANNLTLIQSNRTKCEILDAFRIILKKEATNLEIPEGSPIDQSSEEARHLLLDVYNHVAHKGDIRARSLRHFGIFVDKLKHIYLGPLTGILQGRSPVPLKQSLNRFLSITIGLKELFVKARGGLRGILEKGVKFEVNSLFNGKNGAEVFVYILRQTGAKFNLAVLWGRLLNDIEKVLHIIQLLGGGESKNGVDETFGFLSHIWSALNLRLQVPSLIKYLLESSSEENWTKADDGDFSNVLKDLKNITDEQSKKYDNNGLITPFVSFFSNLTANSLIQEGVNISDLVEKWRKRDIIGGFKSVTDILLKFESPEKYSNILFNSYIAFLNSSSDTGALKRLFPGISLDQFTKQGSSLWDSISKSFNVDTLLKNNGNSTEVLNGIPVFGEFSKIYRDSFGSSFNFTKILNGNTISDYITKGFSSPFKWVTDVFKNPGSIFHHFLDPFRPFLPHLPEIIPTVISPGINKPVPIVTPGGIITANTKIIIEKETEDDNPRTTPLTETNSVSSEQSSVKISTESNEEKPSSTAVLPSETAEPSEKGTIEIVTTQKEEKVSTQVVVEVTTECKDTPEVEFKNHHHHRHHENKHHHENKQANHGSGRHHENKNNENNEKRIHRNSRHNPGETHQNRREDNLGAHHAHREEKHHERSHHHLNA